MIPIDSGEHWGPFRASCLCVLILVRVLYNNWSSKSQTSAAAYFKDIKISRYQDKKKFQCGASMPRGKLAYLLQN